VVDEEACLACGLCADCCPFDALAETPAAPVVDAGRCMGCGVCVSVCEGGALSLARDPDRPAPLLLEQLLTELGTAVDR
jgi:ferredoxin